MTKSTRFSKRNNTKIRCQRVRLVNLLSLPCISSLLTPKEMCLLGLPEHLLWMAQAQGLGRTSKLVGSLPWWHVRSSLHIYQIPCKSQIVVCRMCFEKSDRADHKNAGRLSTEDHQLTISQWRPMAPWHRRSSHRKWPHPFRRLHGWFGSS